jgi:hypothetical protein
VLEPYHPHQFSSEAYEKNFQYAFLLPKVIGRVQMVPDCWTLIILTHTSPEWNAEKKKYLKTLILPFIPQ